MPLDNDDILVITAGFWDQPKRVRHKMPAAWARTGNRVLWLEQSPFPPDDWRAAGRLRNALAARLVEAEPRLWVGAAPPAIPRMHAGGPLGNALRALHRPLFVRRIRRYMRHLDFNPRLVVLFQQAPRHDLLEAFPGAVTVYYCHDLFGYGGAGAAALNEERRCCEKVHLVWTTSDAQRRRLEAFNPQTHHVPHAVDPEWWDHGCGETPTEYGEIPRPRAVYTGVMQGKVDLALLSNVAARRTDWQFVFVGPVIESQLDPSLLARARAMPNMRFLGPRNVEHLPGYIHGADALLLPYILDENRRGAGLALKFFEYFISGVPVIATPYTDFEIDAQDLLDVAQDVGAWSDALDRVTQQPDPESAARRQALARQNTYDDRIAQQRRLLGPFLPRQ